MTRLPRRVVDKLFVLALRFAAALIRRGTRDGRRRYFDPAAFAWTRMLEQAWGDIRSELDEVLKQRESIPNFQEVSPEQLSITDDDRWKSFVFSVFGTRIARNCRRCPRTAALLGAIPGLHNAMFSILAPGKHIPEHRGPYNGLLRYHLALKVPRQRSACVIEVAGELREWQQGRTLIFDDSHLHSVRNDTAEERVVLFADFERPLPWPLAVVNRLVLAWLARTPLARGPIERFAKGIL